MDSFQSLPRVNLSDLTATLRPDDYFLAAEKLNLSLCKNNVCIVKLAQPFTMELEGVMLMYAKIFSQPSLLRACEGVCAKTEASPGFKTVPGRQKFEFRLGSQSANNLPQPAAVLSATVFHQLDSLARLLVCAICRSHGVRLRSDTFSMMLDDMPLAPNTVSTSVYEVVKYCNNLASSATGKPWSFTPQQEGNTHKGFLSIVAQREAVEPDKQGVLSRLQVKSALGRWTDVILEPDEVAVMFGHTACRASGGLFTPASYRLVGEMLGGTGRQSLEFQLHARPDAVINFHSALEAAGHVVADKFATPVSMKELMRQFDNVLTPMSQVRGSQNRSIEFNTLDSDSLRKRGRKRMPFNASPVTRSGKVRRTGGSLIGQVADGQPCSAAQARAAQVSQEAVAQRIYITVDGCNRNIDMFISLQLCWPGHFSGQPVWLRVHPFTKCGRIFEVYCETMGVDLGILQFELKGQRIYGADVAYDLHLQDEDEILVSQVPGTGVAPPGPVSAVPAAEASQAEASRAAEGSDAGELASDL